MLFRFDNSYARLSDAFFQRVHPTPVSAPALIKVNHELASELGVDPAALDSPEGLQVLVGNQLAEGSEPISMAYSGHQFGGFSPQLGDGRAILLGEVVAPNSTRYDIQLKGSGPTPFSRRGDGRSALGPVLREYIVSEAMAALGVPTTRALAAVASGEVVARERPTPGGVFTRVAQSHIRIGTFQWFAARQDLENLKTLADYAISRHYPAVQDEESPYLNLLDGVIERQAKLIANWMQFGFIHGVMNTDNMSISGETIDYGPCAFMDDFDSLKTFSSIDHGGRYAYGRQAEIGLWNLSRFAETLLPLLHKDQKKAIEIAEVALRKFAPLHQAELQRRFLAKLGIDDGDDSDWPLVEELLRVMADGQADFTLVFRHLTLGLENNSDDSVLALFASPVEMKNWIGHWRERLHRYDRQHCVSQMRRSNPIFVPRNHRIEKVIAAGVAGDFEPFEQLNTVLQKPYSEAPQFADYESAPLPEEVVCATFCGT